jgi:mono/diheme cytochrome c family protein
LNRSGLLESGDPTQAIQIVLYGRGQMPAFEGALSNEQIAAVISYERNAWQNDASVVKPAQVRRVQEGESAIAEQPAETPATPTETVTTTGTVNATAGTPTAEAAAATATPMTPPAQTPVAATATATADMASPTVAATEPPTSTVVPGLLEGATPPSLASPALTWTPAREVTPLLPTASTAEDEGTTTPVPAETTPATAASSPQQTGTPTLDVTVSIRGDAGGDDPPLTWTPARQVTPLLPSVGAEEDEGTVTPAPTEETPAPTVAPSPRETDTPQAAETAAATPAPTDTATEVTATTPEEEAATATPQPTETPAETPDQALINLGEEIYATECASCHRLSGEGSSVYPALNESELLISQDPTEAIRIVLYGMGQMPAFADILSTEEIAAVLSYERNAWDNDASVVTVEQVEEVQEAPTPTDAAEEE